MASPLPVRRPRRLRQAVQPGAVAARRASRHPLGPLPSRAAPLVAPAAAWLVAAHRPVGADHLAAPFHRHPHRPAARCGLRLGLPAGRALAAGRRRRRDGPRRRRLAAIYLAGAVCVGGWPCGPAAGGSGCSGPSRPWRWWPSPMACSVPAPSPARPTAGSPGPPSRWSCPTSPPPPQRARVDPPQPGAGRDRRWRSPRPPARAVAVGPRSRTKPSSMWPPRWTRRQGSAMVAVPMLDLVSPPPADLAAAADAIERARRGGRAGRLRPRLLPKRRRRRAGCCAPDGPPTRAPLAPWSRPPSR